MHKTFRQIWYFMRPYWQRYTVISALNVLVAATEYFTLALLMPILSVLAGTGPIATGSRIQSALERILSWLPTHNILLASCMMLLVVALVRFGTQLIQQYVVTSTSGRIMADLRKRIFNFYAGSELDSLLSQKQGRLVYILGISPNKVAGTLMRVPNLSASVVTSLGIFLLLLSVQWKLTFGLTFTAAGFYFLISKSTRRHAYATGKQMGAVSSDANITLNEFVSGFKQITVANAVGRWIRSNDTLSEQISDLYARTNRLLEYPRYFMDLFAVVLVTALISLASVRFGANLPSFLPTLGIFLAAFFRMVPHLSNIGNAGVLIISSLPDLEIVHGVLQQPPAVTVAGTTRFTTLKEAIRFEQVAFKHKDRGMLLDSLSFTLEKNKVTALVGKSGQGKTTIINLLLGFYRPFSGRIWVDRADLAEFDLTSWRSRIGFVSQDSFIFHATIAENIGFDDPRFNLADIEEAARIANAHEFITSFPEGYRTVVGERGMKLSGGQQQRIAIARAVIRKPEIYIFDEATSSLDPISERAVQQAIQALSQGHTTLIVTHRLAAVEHADHILLLQDGRILEQGSHADLLSRQDQYWELHRGG
ncbi:MAG: ABC transporter ATP-binding protein [Elusimicrobiota bacterium]|jgi:ABC-type multidrug transport system fused ATPase/permease subunit